METTSHLGGKSSAKKEPNPQENIAIGSNTRIWVRLNSTRYVESECNVVCIPGRAIKQSGAGIKPLNQSELANTESKFMKTLINKINDLGKKSWKIYLLENKTSRQRRPSQDSKYKIFTLSTGEAK